MTVLRCLMLLVAIGTSGCGQPLFTPRPVAPTPLPSRSVVPAAIREIRQVHTQCFGWCPAFSFALRRDGTAAYHGDAYVPVIGPYVAAVDSVTFDRLARYLVRRGFFRLAPYYSEGLTDQASTITTAVLEGDSVVVSRYGTTGPWELVQMEEAIDSVAARLRWSPQP